jgi:hypothetical protein
MSVTFGGVPLTSPTEQIVDLMKAHGEIPDLFSRPQWTGVNGREPDFSDPPEIKLGRVLWPTGASHFATGVFLATQSQLEAIVKVVAPSQLSVPATSGILKLWDEEDPAAATTISLTMYLLRPWPLFQSSDTDSDIERLWLLPLVDSRYFWWQKSDEVLVTESSTWTTLVAAVVAALETTQSPALGTVDDDYLIPHESLSSSYDYLPPLLDAIAYSIGRRVVVNYNGTLSLQKPQNAVIAQDALLTTWATLTTQGGSHNPDAYPNDYNLPFVVPSNVVMSYPELDIRVADTTEPTSYDTDSVTLASITAINSLYRGVKQYTADKVVQTTAIRWMDGVSPQNDTQLLALATQWAEDWYRWQATGQFRVFGTIVPWIGDGGVAYTEWETWPRLQTRITRPPINDTAKTTYHRALFPGVCPGAARTDRFLAKVGCREVVSGIYAYTFDEMEITAPLTTPTVLTGGRKGYPAPTFTVTQTQIGTASLPSIQTISFCGNPPKGGTWTITTSAGTTGAINFNATAASTAGTVQYILQAVGGAVSGVTVTGGPLPGSFVFTFPANGAQTAFTASSSSLTPSTYSWPAQEVNNQKTPNGTLVWMSRAFTAASPAKVSFTRTSTNPDTFSFYYSNVTGGSWTLTFDDIEIDIDYGLAAGSIEGLIEAAVGGLTLTTFTGSGTSGSPWVFNVSSDTALHTFSVEACNLRDGSGYAFAKPFTTCQVGTFANFDATAAMNVLVLDASQCIDVEVPEECP